MKTKLNHSDYEFIVWKLAKTLKKLGYKMHSPLKAGYNVYATKYGLYRGKYY